MSKMVIGVYDSESEAIDRIQALVDQGYNAKDISILAKDDGTMDRVADKTNVSEEHLDEDVNEAAYGTIAGFLSGIGGAIAVPGLGVPGIGPLLAAGPFASMFSEDSEEDLKELLMSLDLSERTAERYVQKVEQGSVMVFLEKDAVKL
ncbi:general stress protein [Fictibacillus enclensis]|uniref:general stress protein n=1 Tax=Fictibacillus enclensis TaxID=1017270 RepID=UPI0024C02F5D|nr:general stress protein [Fictibacillus enclensis]MDM5337018.1 general stress protein [Fictibacillus enclensis]WHY73458.1 general stress protein [Fictibacillus enclensis]